MGAEQLNSYESQKKYYYEKINDNPEWQFVDIYADEGISGTTDYRRASFMRMIQDAISGKIDLILTKSISRFGRNTMDVLKNVRLFRFILKREFDLSVPKEIPEELIIKNNKIDTEGKNVLVDFINTRQYFSFEKDENGKLNKVLQNGLRIRVECDII